MGFFMSSLQGELSTFHNNVRQWTEPLEKVKDYHGVFKSVCDTFVIRRDQFSQIFGSEQKLILWQGNTTINALQVFCGLGFYSTCPGFRLKLKFLFALFDFNEIKSISVVDLQYMILSILNFTYRILGRTNSRADELRLAEWLMRFVNPHKRININALARFCVQSEEARSFLRMTNNTEEEVQAKASEGYDQEKDMEQAQRLALLSERKQLEVNTKVAWFSNFTQKLTKPKYKKEVVSTTSVSWVYGIDLTRFSTPFILLGDGRILYAISTRIVIYCTERKCQSIYSRHTREVQSFAVHEPSFIIASSEGENSPKVHIWDFRTLETLHILRIDHSHKVRLLAFSPSGTLAVIGAREQSPVVLFDCNESLKLKTSFAVQDEILMIIPFFSPLQMQTLPESLINMFVLAGKRTVLVVDSKYQSHPIKYQSPITSIAVSYMSSEQPYLRYFTGQSLRMFIVTAHESGSILVSIFDPSILSALFDPDKYELFKFQEPPKQILLTAESFFIILLNEVRVYDLSIFTFHQERTSEEHSRIIRSSDAQDLRLLSNEFLFAAVDTQFIFLVTVEGDFLQISDREVDFDGSLHEQENIKRLDEFVKLGGKLRAACFAQREKNGTLMVVSENKKVFEIDPVSHKVSLILEIGYEDVITVIDYAISQEGPAYTICGSLSGRLLVRVDEQEVAKVYDCQTEVTDLKISRDASYLLVATLNSVMFFQLLPSFSSPRKITFQNESPITLNYLDNPRFCSVGTSAKNIYLIEVPQLRHRNVQKDNESFSATRMAVDFPHRQQNISSKLSYSRCFVGGDMKFYLLTLTTGEVLYFPSMSSLQHRNYILQRAHQCPISNVVMSEDQSLYYTIGESDCMLLEWAVQQQRPPFVKKKNDDKQSLDLPEPKMSQVFKRIKVASQIHKRGEEDLELCTFFFRGTRSDKLNKKLHESLKLNTENYGEDKTQLMKRHCPEYLRMSSVYGLQSNKGGQVRYLSHRTEDSRLLYTASRFLIQTYGQGCHNERIYETATHIAYFTLSELSEPVYAESGQCPRIFVSGVEALRTLHKNGLIHFTLFGDFLLSFGLENECYSINVHNYRTGQLIAERTTYHPITQFLMLSPNYFVSLPDVRIWTGLIASEVIGYASSGTVLPGGTDICLGGLHGQLSILSENGLFLMASNAHGKEIIAIQTNQLPSSFQIITASLDETVKIWNQYFQQLLTINLSVTGQFKILRELGSLAIADATLRSQAFAVRSLDCKHNKILLSMSLGQIWEYEISAREEKVRHSQDLDSSANLSSSSQDENMDLPFRSQRVQMNYFVDRKRILNAHCSQSVHPLQRYATFDIHSEWPLFASAGSDSRIIFRDYLREEVVGNYICERDEQVKVRAVRFSPKGRMLVVGLTSGVVMTFFMDLSLDNIRQISSLSLRHFQTFRMDEGGPYEIMVLEFNASADTFAVSYIQQFSSKRQKSGDPRQSTALIRIFKAKSQKNQNLDEAFYEPKDDVRLRQEQSATKSSRCAIKLLFQTQQGKTYLFMTEEYFDNQGVRLFSPRGRYSVFCLQDKALLTDEFSINWERASFPNLINLKYQDPSTDETQDSYAITAMLRYKDTIIYGGMDGKLHLVKVESLDTVEEISEYRVSDMCLSRIFSALTTPITDLKVATSQNRKFLFVGGYGDDCIVKFELIEEDAAYFLQHKAYPLETEDPMKEFLNKEHFYLTINNRQPLREQLSNILQDVENEAKGGVHLQFVKAFGRRAIDRRYNLTYFDNNLLYSLGPNLVVQDLKTSAQYLLKADPSPYSHCPQISAFHYNNRFLIVATEEQRSNIYVWDIKSKSCINFIQIECSFVLIIRFIGESEAVYYGINDKYEPVVSIIDWRSKHTLGTMRLAYTSLSAVRDLTPITIKGGRQFVTCGFLHLCYWQIRGDTLVYHNFNSQSSGRYTCIKELNGYLVTGCEEGHLYLWHQFQLIHVLQNAHSAAIRCLEVDTHNELFISGGKDGLVIFLKIQENKLCPFNRVYLDSSSSKEEIQAQAKDSFEIQLQIQSLSPNPSLQNDNFQALLVGTRSGSIYEIQYNESTQTSTLLFQNHDNQTVVSATFSSYDTESFFTLTNAGLIERFSISTLSRTMRFDLGQRALKIQSCGQYLLICCKQELLAYRIMIKQSTLERSDSFCIDTRKIEEDGKEIQIIRFCLSKSEKLLAICSKNCAKEPTYQISIYNLSSEKLHQLSNLKHQVDYLDFSIDDKYLLFKDRYEEIGMISLEKDYRRINTIFVEMGIEWQQQALRLSPSAQNIYYSYSCENKITALSRLGNDKLIVGDQMGTVRVFDYPCPDDRLGELHLHCYCVHMNDIAEIVVHPQLNYVLSIGLQDRSLVLWKVGYQ